MGLFDFLGGYNQIERSLLELYTQCYITMIGADPSEAKQMVEKMLKQAIEESKKEGSYYLPHNFGDIILGDAEADDPAIKEVAEEVKEKLPKKRAEGVRDEDIRWWGNLNDVERRMMLKQDKTVKLALAAHKFETSAKQTKEEAMDDAFDAIRSVHPIYGDPDDTTHAKGKDRPLPIELKNRIDIYIQKRATTDPEKYKKEIKQTSSFNALVRREIKAGNL